MSNSFLRRYRATTVAVVSGTVILIFAFCDVDLIQLGSWFVNFLQPHRIDDFVAAVALVIIGLSLDYQRDKRQYKLELQSQADRVEVLKATMRTVQDLVNNFINSMQLVRHPASRFL